LIAFKKLVSFSQVFSTS